MVMMGHLERTKHMQQPHKNDSPECPAAESATERPVDSSLSFRVERQIERQPRLLSLQPVTVEAHWELREPVWRFYADVLGLGNAKAFVEPAGSLLLIFRNDGPDLLIRLTSHPEIWANRPRIVLEMPDFATISQRLASEMIEHQVLTGWTWPDRRIGLWDPSGNRLEIKRLWSLRG